MTMQKSFFQKRSIGFAALSSVRDWAIIAVIVAGVLGLREAALLWLHMDPDLVRSTLIGTCCGMLPPVLICLPVRGVVDELSRDAFQSFLKSIKFTRHFERDGTLFYTQDTPSWMRWDSNCVAIERRPNGQLGVTMPLYCYRILRRRG